MARVKPDLKGLVSARSYMLKMLVEKVFTKKELCGKGKKAKILQQVIAENKKNNANG
jgi:hypothetical protein